MIKKSENDIRSILYRMDKKAWARLTHLKADGKIKSYQAAIDAGLALLLKKIDNPGGQQGGQPPIY
jgi:hypothetical protein